MAKKRIQKRKSSYFRIGRLKIKKKLIIPLSCVTVIVIGFLLFRNSSYWPWPSQEEIDQRLIDVVDACMYNESSRACKNLQSRYSMSFEYCHALSDIPEIGVEIPIYGIAKRNTFTPSSLNYQPATKGSTLPSPYPSSGDKLADNIRSAASGGYTSQTGTEGDSKYPYYGCVGSLEEITNQKGANLIDDPKTIALFGLSKVPQYSMTYDPHGNYGCTFHYAHINNLWKQVPNISVIRDEADNLSKIYPDCGAKIDIDSYVANLNTKLNNYANSYSVQVFYQKYDEWTVRKGTGCTWNDIKFDGQLCGAASDGESAGSDVMVKDFVADMSRYLHTKYFTSKIVVAN